MVGNSNEAVTWDVNGVVGGNSVVGFIDSIGGRYTAPAVVPSPATVTVHATSKAVSSAVGNASVTIATAPPVKVSITPKSPSVRVGKTKQFTATVTNATNTAVRWEVNGVVGGNSTVGEITAAGLYTAPAAIPSPDKVTVTAVSVADPSESATAKVTVTAK